MHLFIIAGSVDVPEMAVEKSIAKLLCLQKLGWLKLTLVQITITVQRVTWLGACESEEGETLRPVFYGTFDYDTRQYDLEGLFSKYGPISRIDIKSGYAFIYFEDERDAEDAIRRLDNVSFGSRRRLSVEWSRQVEPVSRSRDTMPTGDVKRTRTLFVINFDPIRSKVKDIERHFEPYGKIAIYKHSCLKELYFCTV